MKLRSRIAAARRNPKLARRVLRGLAGGLYYRMKFRILRRRVYIGRRFQVYGRLDIRGPGAVIFGDDCTVVSTRLAPTTPYTHSRDAVLRIGNRVMLAGTRIGCQQLIEFEDDADVSEARIMDTDFHRVEARPEDRSRTRGVPQAVRIGAGAWIGLGAIVLKGVRIGANSVVSAGAVVAYDVPPNVVVFGNPARVVRRLDETSKARTPVSPEAPARHGAPESTVRGESGVGAG